MLTLFLGSLCACCKFDVKKIIAFSTLRHLGFMFFCLSRNIVLFSFFHLIIHACFKALLFISGGMLILVKKHCQDFRQMGIKIKKIFFIWVL